MTTKYRRILERRQDMTNWLIHFTRDSVSMAARSVLSKILTEGVLRPSFAPRGVEPKNVIYGPHKAVCFSEQPLAAFLQLLSARNDTGETAGYGVLIHKCDLYAAGGLPVIYGLGAAEELPPGDSAYASQRLLDPSRLGLSEQYRYVAFVPNREPKPIDWTHEREWRWAGAASPFPKDLLSLGTPSSGPNGMFNCRVHSFVQYDCDVAWLQAELQRARTAGLIGKVTSPELHMHQGHWMQRVLDVRIVSLEMIQRELRSNQKAFARFEDIQIESLPRLIAQPP